MTETVLPRLWFMPGLLGATSEIWLKRQIELIGGFRVHTVAWGYHPNPTWDVTANLHILNAGSSPAEGVRRKAGRWLGRLRDAPSGNFYQCRGQAHLALLDLARTCSPDVILAHYGHTGLAMRPIAQALGVPLVVHFHGHDLSSSLRNRWYRWSLLHELPRFDGMVVVGAHQRDWLLENGAAPERVHLIPCGVPVAEFCTADARLPGQARFLTVSRLVPQKGLDICLQALAQIASDYSEATLTIVGEGPERDRLERMIAHLGLEGRVRFTGALRPAKVREEMQAATVFLQHSLELNGWVEGFGVSVTEAAAMELPVIVSRSGGLVDQVVDGTTGFIVDQRDVAGLAAAMRRLCATPDRARAMGQAGHHHVARNFDTQGQVQKLENLLGSLLQHDRLKAFERAPEAIAGDV